MKKHVFILGAFIFTSSLFAENRYVNMCLENIGQVCDTFYAPEDLKEDDQRILNDVAQELGIEDRGIKGKNSNVLIRLFGGYNNALSFPFNRIYFNQSELDKMTIAEKRCLMAHELTHIHKYHGLKRIIFNWLFIAYLEKMIDFFKQHREFTGKSDMQFMIEAFIISFPILFKSQYAHVKLPFLVQLKSRKI